MGSILGTLFRKLFRSGRLVRFENSGHDKKKTATVNCLEQLKEKARAKLGIPTDAKISVVEWATGHEIEDEECFSLLGDRPRITILNESKGEIWTRPQDMPMQSHPPLSLSPYHQVTRDASGSLTTNINVVSIQAQSAQMGDHNQILSFGGSREPTQDEDTEA